MSYPVKYSEVAILAQDFLEGLSPPTSKVMVDKLLPVSPFLLCSWWVAVAVSWILKEACKNNILFSELLYRKKGYKQVLKTFLKMLKDVGMAVPKTTETRCRDGSVQARHAIQKLHK